MHWPGELRRLPGYSVVALDLPGHGHSKGVAQQSIGAYAQVVKRFTEGLSLPRFVLVGHSMGGAVAQELALQHPELIAGLVLVATGAKLPVAPELLNIIQGNWENAARLLASWSQGTRADPKALYICFQRLRELDPQVLYRDYAACNAWDRTAELDQIGAPTLVVCGDADKMTPPEYSLRLAHGIKTAHLIIIPGAGHMVMLEQPTLVARAVQQFIPQLPGRASPSATVPPLAQRVPGD
jgi:pimeloyl-ACP methyl ester carboxylesterase